VIYGVVQHHIVDSCSEILNSFTYPPNSLARLPYFYARILRGSST
jgi:hypothetical protein